MHKRRSLKKVIIRHTHNTLRPKLERKSRKTILFNFSLPHLSTLFFWLIDSNLAQPGTGATTSESRIGQTGKARQSDSLLVPAALSFRFITDGATTRLHMNSALFLPVYYIRWIIHSLVVDFFLRYFFFFGAPLSRSTETTHTGHVLCVSFQCHQSLTHKLKEVEKVACIVCAILHNNLVEVRWRMMDDCVNCSWRSCISTR